MLNYSSLDPSSFLRSCHSLRHLFSASYCLSALHNFLLRETYMGIPQMNMEISCRDPYHNGTYFLWEWYCTHLQEEWNGNVFGDGSIHHNCQAVPPIMNCSFGMFRSESGFCELSWSWCFSTATRKVQ